MIVTSSASPESSGRPRSRPMRMWLPSSACTAVAPQADEHLRSDESQLRLKPREARGDLRAVRLLVDATFAAELVAEMLDDIRDVDVIPRDPRLVEPAVEQPPAGPTNGCPSMSSRSPGCSPTNITSASRTPSPKTACVAPSHSSQARHSGPRRHRRSKRGGLVARLIHSRYPSSEGGTHRSGFDNLGRQGRGSPDIPLASVLVREVTGNTVPAVNASQDGRGEAGPRVLQVRGLASAVLGPLSARAAYIRRTSHA